MLPLTNSPHNTYQIPFICWIMYLSCIQFPAPLRYWLDARSKVPFQYSSSCHIPSIYCDNRWLLEVLQMQDGCNSHRSLQCYETILLGMTPTSDNLILGQICRGLSQLRKSSDKLTVMRIQSQEQSYIVHRLWLGPIQNGLHLSNWSATRLHTNFKTKVVYFVLQEFAFIQPTK